VDNSSDFYIRDGTLICYIGNSSQVIIPPSVTAIGREAFENNHIITNVIVEGELLHIGDGAFYNCRNLHCFRHKSCKNTEGITIPETVKHIGSEAFGLCENVKYLAIVGELDKLDKMAFANCTSLRYVEVSADIKNIGKNVFKGVTNLNLRLGNKTKCDFLFLENKDLERIVVSGDNAVISEGMFCNCSNLVDVKLSEGVTKIKRGAFSCCFSLKKISFSKCMRKIDKMAFAYCVELEEIRCPVFSIKIDECAFLKCSELEETRLYLGKGCLLQ